MNQNFMDAMKKLGLDVGLGANGVKPEVNESPREDAACLKILDNWKKVYDLAKEALQGDMQN